MIFFYLVQPNQLSDFLFEHLPWVVNVLIPFRRTLIKGVVYIYSFIHLVWRGRIYKLNHEINDSRGLYYERQLINEDNAVQRRIPNLRIYNELVVQYLPSEVNGARLPAKLRLIRQREYTSFKMPSKGILIIVNGDISSHPFSHVLIYCDIQNFWNWQMASDKNLILDY